MSETTLPNEGQEQKPIDESALPQPSDAHRILLEKLGEEIASASKIRAECAALLGALEGDKSAVHEVKKEFENIASELLSKSKAANLDATEIALLRERLSAVELETQTFKANFATELTSLKEITGEAVLKKKEMQEAFVAFNDLVQTNSASLNGHIVGFGVLKASAEVIQAELVARQELVLLKLMLCTAT